MIKMEITKTYNWNRRDFSYDAKCQFCGHVTNDNYGYDDDNYYNNVVPNTKCKNCGESTISKGQAVETVIPKHDPFKAM